jgi:CRISPR-associated protein Csx17
VTHQCQLGGCRPEPLASYLKALGVFRMVATQADREATGHWGTDCFVLGTTLDDAELERFFLDRYQPTPVVSPWNSSSGFGPEGVGELRAIEESSDARLAEYRQAIRVGRELLDRAEVEHWAKEQVVSAARSSLPDRAVAWIDAAVILDASQQLGYPPLLGTGGNLGRLELSRNFHRRVLEVLSLASKRRKPGQDPRAWLRDALWGSADSVGLIGESPGQFDPGTAKSVNSAPEGFAEPLSNPWDFVLLMEGAILFASGSARRLAAGGHGAGQKPSGPFMVPQSSAVGYAGAAEGEKARGEFWAPLWERPTTLAELRGLLAEGRADWSGRQARSGLELAKAAATLGVDRGLSGFVRYAFVERLGQTQAAVSAGCFGVTLRQEAIPLADLDRWLERVRRSAEPPASVSSGLRAVERAQFSVARTGSPADIIQVLAAAARLEEGVWKARIFRERNGLRPIEGLEARRWVPALLGHGGGYGELRLALSMAASHDVGGTDRRTVTSLRCILRPISIDTSGRPQWSDDVPVPGLGVRSVFEVLAEAHARRVLEVLSESSRAGSTGVATRWSDGLPTPLADVATLARGDVDGSLLGVLLVACLLLDWTHSGGIRLISRDPVGPVPPGLAVLGPFFAEQALDPEEALVPDASWPAQMAVGRGSVAVAEAAQRLKIAGRAPVVRGEAVASGIEVHRSRVLGAALLARLSLASRDELLQRCCPPDPSADGLPEEEGDATP